MSLGRIDTHSCKRSLRASLGAVTPIAAALKSSESAHALRREHKLAQEEARLSALKYKLVRARSSVARPLTLHVSTGSETAGS